MGDDVRDILDIEGPHSGTPLSVSKEAIIGSAKASRKAQMRAKYDAKVAETSKEVGIDVQKARRNGQRTLRTFI